MRPKTNVQPRRIIWLGVVGSIMLASAPATTLAQIAGDGTLGTQVNGSTIAPCTGVCTINGGVERGVNLYHSFKEFSIPTGGQAWFNNAPQIQNILTRVTGNTLSSIDGLLKANGTANLFLLNPNGIVFGRYARLQIGGSFLATTANSFKFPGGSEFSAINPQAPPLLAVTVTPGLQYGPTAASITNRGNLSAGQDLTLAASNLDVQGTVQAGRDLTLKAQDTVQIRDSAIVPLVVQSGRDLTIQGNQRVDILALNHPQTAIQSGRNLNLISDGVISGDAHFSSSGGFQIRSLSGQLATFISLYDPIISSAGNVDITASYTGASLLIESQGSVRIGGGVTINAPDTVSTFVGNDAVLSSQPGLIIRSGQTNLVYGGNNQNNPPVFAPGIVPVGITLDAGVGVSSNAQSGIVRLVADNGGIFATSISISNVLGGQPGIIEGTAVGDIAIGGLISSSANITLNSTQGAINVAGAITQGSSPGGGNIQFSAFGDITTGSLSAISLFGERGGDITLVSRTGSINTSEGNLLTFTVYGPQGGNITLSAYGNIITTDLIANGRANAGNIQLTSQTGTINTTSQPDPLSTQQGFVQAASAFGKGGTITLSAPGGIVTANVSSASAIGSGDITLTVTHKDGAIQTQNLVSYAEDGDAGSIRLSAIDGDIETRSLISSGKSRSGDITIRTQGNFTSRSSAILTSTYGDGASGNIAINAGSVSLTAGTQVSTATSNRGAGGNITIIAPDFVRLSGTSNDTTIPGLEQQPDGLFAVPDNPLTLPEGTKISGFIPPASFSLQFGTVTFPSGLYTQTSGITGAAGRAGDVTLQTSHLVIEDRAAIAATTFGTGSAGNVSIQATNIVVDNGGIFSGVGANALGNSGAIALNTDTLTLTNGGTVQALTLGSGKAGDIQIVARQAIDLTEGKSDRQIASGILSGSDGVGNSGQGGNIRLTTPILTVAGDAQIAAATVNSGNAGNIGITADAFTLSQGATVSTNTFASGQAGNLTVNVTGQLLLTGRGTGLFASTTVGSTGNGGNIVIDPRVVLVQDGAAIAVNSQGIGQGGNIQIQAGSLTLDRQGVISAQTASSQGGNIILNVQDLLLLRHGSQISTSAGTAGTAQAAGDGGKININSKFVVAVLAENSDITANAFTGSGGRVDITARGIFGLTYQPKLTRFSDITASSQFGVNGTVNLNILNLDPSRGLVALPLNLTDPSQQISQSCTPGDKAAASSFVSTGRGGIPLNPDEPLESRAVVTKWVALPAEGAGKAEGAGGARGGREGSHTSDDRAGRRSANKPEPIVEAQGWVARADGTIVLVVDSPTPNPASVWTASVDCQAAQGR